ncbi:MAG: ATP-binding protein [Acidobacteriota bacterium]|nr:ATP-binding protein [Acidobacteriota bacterium]
MDQTQHEFLVEIEELVEQTFADLDELREKQNDGRSRRELIDRIFREVHSVKGSAASCGLEAVSQIAHEFENLLDAVRGGRTVLDNGVLDTCESASEALAESVSLAASGIFEPDRRPLFARLQAAAQGTTPEPDAKTEAIFERIPFEIRQSLSPPEKHRLISVVEEGSAVLVVETSFDVSSFDEQFTRLKELLGQNGEVISTSPTVDNEHPSKINFRVVYASQLNTQHLQTRVIEFSDVTFKEVAQAGSGKLDEEYKHAVPLASSFAPVSSLSNFVHTDLDKLDRLISSTHELSRATSNALEVAMSQKQLPSSARERLRDLHEQIRNSFMGVEDELINLRMVSLGPTLQRAGRAGRGAARQAGKEIDFEIAGADLLIDKLLAEAIVDPLIHLVRNAVGHGIESPEERARAGKKARGNVRIEAVDESSRCRIRVTDDGHGIDPRLISEAAMRLGLVADDSDLDFERSVRLIFRPGFTTLDSASKVSGRGVGLDVVETTVEQLGGELRVSSKPTGGATFEIRLPVTFGLLTATVVVSGSRRYCIAANQMLSIDAIDATKANRIIKKREAKSGADQLPVISLRELLGEPAGQSQRKKSSLKQSQLITCHFPDEQVMSRNNGSQRIGIIVDRVEGTEEVLVRNLGRHAGRWYGVAGATELRDGTVALVLDLPRLLNDADFIL